MSVSGTPAGAEINIDEFERRLRAPNAQKVDATVSLTELAQLIESSGLAGGWSPAPAETVSTDPVQSSEFPPAPPPIALDETSETGFVEEEAPQAFDDGYAQPPSGPGFAKERRSGSWAIKAPALAAAGVALVAVVFGLRGGVPGSTKAPPFVAAAQGPTKEPPPSVKEVASSSNADATPFKDITPVNAVNPEAPSEANAQISLGNAPQSPIVAPTPTGAAQPATGASDAPPAVPPIKSPLVAPVGGPPLAASHLPDSKLVRTASMPPDPTPDAKAPPSRSDSSEAAHLSDAPQPPAKPATQTKPATKTGKETAAVAEPSTPKLDLPAKPKKSPARLMVAKADATAPSAAAETQTEPLRPQSSTTTPEAATEQPAAAAPPAAPPEAAQQPANPLGHALGYIVGALEAPAAAVLQPRDQSAAARSGSWAIQFAAPKSEAEAKSDLSRLNAKYGPALNGATIGVHKTQVSGETVYALQVGGLSKAEAAALCSRVKGRDCSLTK